MADGPGKYDHLATVARQSANARAVAVIVIDGVNGSGFSVQALGGDVTAQLPAILRHLADEIETDVAVDG